MPGNVGRDGHHAAPGPHDAAGTVHGRHAETVEANVHVAYDLLERLLAIVDDVVGAQGSDELCVALTAGGRDPSTQRLRNLDGHGAYAS